MPRCFGSRAGRKRGPRPDLPNAQVESNGGLKLVLGTLRLVLAIPAQDVASRDGIPTAGHGVCAAADLHAGHRLVVRRGDAKRPTSLRNRACRDESERHAPEPHRQTLTQRLRRVSFKAPRAVAGNRRKPDEARAPWHALSGRHLAASTAKVTE